MSLSYEEEERFKTMAKQATNDLIHNAFVLQQLKMHARVQNQKTNRQAIIYSGRDSVNPTLPMVGAHTFVSASLETIADFFHLDTPAKCDAYSATLGTRIVARQELLPLVLRQSSTGASTASCTISWYAYESPMMLLSRRDFCVLEVQNFIQVADRQNVTRKGYVRCLHSVHLPWCPPMPDMVRGSLARSGIVALETDTPGLLEVFYIMIPVDMGSPLPVSAKALARRQVEKILRLEEYLAYQQLEIGKLSNAQPLPSRSNVTHCSHCPRKFRWYRSKRQCHRCFDAVCSSCGSEWPVRGKKVFVCHDCFRPDGDDLKLDSTRPMTISMTRAKMNKLIEAVATPDITMDEDLTADEFEMGYPDDVLQLVCSNNALNKLCDQYKTH